MPSVGRVYPSLANCAPPPPSSRRACQPFLKGRPPHNMLFPVNPPKSGAPHSSAFAPTGQTASPPPSRSAPCPAGQGSVAPRAQFRPVTLPPPPPQAQDQRFHPPPTSPSPQPAAGGKPLLVGLPPSAPSTAPPETQRSAHAPCSWGMGACTRGRRRWPPALPAFLTSLPLYKCRLPAIIMVETP